MTKSFFKKYIWYLPDINTVAGLKNSRLWLINAMMLFALIAFPIGMIFTLPIFLQKKVYTLIVIDLIIYLIIAFVYFFKKGSSKLVPYLWLLLAYILMVSFFIFLGPHYERSAWLLMISIMSAIFFNKWGAVLSIILNAVVLLVIYSLVDADNAAWAGVFNRPHQEWLMFVINISLISLICSFPVGFLFKRLDLSKEALSLTLCGDAFNCLNSFGAEGCGQELECSQCPLRSLTLSTFQTGEPSLKEGQMTFLINGNETVMDLLISTSLLDINGNKKVLLSLTDISEDKDAIKSLRAREEQHKAILQTAMDGFWLSDKNGKLLEVNETYCRMSGYSPDELLKMNISDLEVVGTEAAKISNRLIKITETKKDRFESRHRRKDETVFDVKVSVQYRDDDGGCYICFLRDITGQKQLEKQIQHPQKMVSIGNLAGGIAHDFNNILFPIIGLAEMLTEDLPVNSPERENASEIMIAGKRGRELVKQILAFSRPHEHKLIPVRMQHVLKEVLKLSRASIPMNIDINQFLQQDCGLVLADPSQMHQIGMNLITNAYHAVQNSGGKIGVEVREIKIKHGLTNFMLPPGDYAMLSVSDNGIGIDKAHLDKIFEPYFTTKENGKGMGLGLSVAYGIVKEHKGDINVMSEPGVGTTFQVYLPLLKTSEIVEPNFEQVPVETGTEHILLVDDEPPIGSDMAKEVRRVLDDNQRIEYF
ncbi:ATP-binding protein [Desulfobacula sp.]|uniref:ATP-binding protein n=1 Tax=Desulfobacula sp. TaxID=2593537 RepID=UPI002603C8B5|nr:ATP-binding protein [Desulfobacula sp.]